jgi:2-polyprenyl-3-methyl-5-hydroxy-6-metoxy-1,4-benzoquinol methylase
VIATKSDLELTFVKCCICRSNDATVIGNGQDFEYHTSRETFSVVRCNSCGLIYLNPRPVISEFKKIYPSTYHAYNFSKNNFGFPYKVRSFIEKWRLMKDCRRLPDNARILDIGCGDGFHLSLLAKSGKKNWSLEGIDIDKNAVEAARLKGLKVHMGTIEELDLPEESYDLIFMIMTIEHVERPDKTICSIKKLLKKGGRLVIVTDNTNSVDFKFFKKHYWGGYHFPRHWNLFSRHSLKRLAKKTGFDVINLRTIVSPVNWVYSIHNALVDRGRPKWLVDSFTLRSTFSLSVFTVLDFIFQKFGRGALLKGVLRKPL